MKIFIESVNGLPCIRVVAQRDTEFEILRTMLSGSIMAEPQRGELAYLIMPDLKSVLAQKHPNQYANMAHDDLMTLAVQKGIPVKRDTLTADLKAILNAYDENPEKAKEMATLARPATKKRTGIGIKDIQPSGGSSRTFSST